MNIEREETVELLDLTRENNKILRAIRRAERVRSVFSLFYWLVVLGAIFGVYYYFQPVIQKYSKIIKSSLDILQSIENKTAEFPVDPKMLKNFMKQ